jgi:hypothetical protein
VKENRESGILSSDGDRSSQWSQKRPRLYRLGDRFLPAAPHDISQMQEIIFGPSSFFFFPRQPMTRLGTAVTQHIADGKI